MYLCWFWGCRYLEPAKQSPESQQKDLLRMELQAGGMEHLGHIHFVRKTWPHVYFFCSLNNKTMTTVATTRNKISYLQTMVGLVSWGSEHGWAVVLSVLSSQLHLHLPGRLQRGGATFLAHPVYMTMHCSPGSGTWCSFLFLLHLIPRSLYPCSPPVPLIVAWYLYWCLPVMYGKSQLTHFKFKA